MDREEAEPRRDGWHWSRRPMVPAAIALILGIFAHQQMPVCPMVYLVASAGLLIAAVVLFKWPRVCSACIAGDLFLGGILLAQLQMSYYPADHIGAFASEAPRLAQIEVRIVDPPRLLTPPPNRFPATSPHQFTSGQVLGILTKRGWQKAQGEILLHLDEPHPRLAAGQRVRILGMLSRPSRAMNPGQFDWAEHYRRQRVLASLSVDYTENVAILDAQPPSILDRLRSQSRALLAEGFGEDRSLDHALLRALLLGDRHPELRDVQDDFKRTGTGHHLSTSGLHIAIVGLVVMGICRLLCCSPRLSITLGLTVTILYGLVALPSPPILRSVLLAGALSFGLLLRRSVDGIHLLALAALAMLIYDPMDLFNAGFQLSFGTVLGMMIGTGTVAAGLRRIWKEDRDILVAQQFAPRWDRSLAAWGRGHIITILAAGITAWIVSLPLIGFHFEQLNPWAIPASIGLAPLVFLSVVAGVLKILLTGLFPGLSPLWATIAIWPVAAMRHTVDWLAHWPRADVPLPAPPLWLIVIWYACLTLPLLPISAPRLQRALRWAAPVALVLLIVIQIAMIRPERTPGGLRMTTLSVGAGQCAVVELPGGQTILFDAGSDSFADLHRTCLDPFLRHRGIRHIDALFLSHANTDHFNAAADLAHTFDVGRVYLSPSFLADSAKNASARNMLAELKRLSVPIITIAAGQRLSLDEQTAVEILWPVDETLKGNDASQVLRLTCRDRSILFGGDIQALAEGRLLADPDSIRADVLLAPHHGSAEKSTGEFLHAVRPTLILCSNDRRLTMKQKHFDELAGGTELRRTHDHGAITLEIDSTGAMKVMDLFPPR